MLHVISRPIEAVIGEIEMLVRSLREPVIGGAAAGPWVVYGSAVEKIGNKLIDLDNDTFKLVITGDSHTPDAATHDELADLSDESPNYTRPTLTPNWSRSGTTTTFDETSNPSITATGGAMAARYAHIYDDTVAGDPLIAYCDLNVGGPELTIASGDVIIINMHANGVFRFVPAA